MGGMPGSPESFQGSHGEVSPASEPPADAELLSSNGQARVTGVSTSARVQIVADVGLGLDWRMLDCHCQHNRGRLKMYLVGMEPREG